MLIRYPLIAVATLLLGACAAQQPKFACGVPSGVRCLSVPDVYAATDGDVPDNGYGAPRTRDSGTTRVPSLQPAVLIEGTSLTLTDAAAPAVYPLEHAPAAVPVRAPAKVLRIWFSPWEDDAGDLVMAGHVFTEIEPRKWSIGEASAPEIVSLIPLQVLSPAPAAPTQTAADATATPR